MICKGSIAPDVYGWESFSSDMVKCPVCGYWTHWQNSREHTAEDKRRQCLAAAQWRESRAAKEILRGVQSG